MTNAPAIDSAVQTTPPIMSAATMPSVPLRPTATITTEARMSVMSVIPDTGLLPTMAIALAATVVKRKAITATSSMPATAKSRLPSITPAQKNTKVINIVAIAPTAIILKGMSRCVRATCLPAFLPPRISRAARLTAFFMMPHELMMPMMPAMAMPPMPMYLP